MVALVFLLVVTAVFGSILALEGGDERLARRPTGLLSWIASGNWPAKIGGGLMIVGVGALLRYAAINFDLPDQYKIVIGILAAAVLGAGSFLTASHPARRAISLALGGAAFGVAYLTAYSAFAIFDYLPTMQGLGLLALTAVGAGIFAVTRSAQSLAVLSMVGAFIAPAFAVDDPGPQVVYGYYVAVSLLVFAMVALRGWRPLIHLSFLFTLAGGAFFAWTAGYFSRANAGVMLPLLVMLVAAHVAMPLFERRWARGRVVESLDTVYLLALPLVATLTSVALAPSRAALSAELWWFSGIWFAAAGWLYSQKREGMAAHAIIGLLLLGIGVAARYRDLPWELVSLAVAVGSLSLAARRTKSARLQGFLAGLVLVLSAVHILSALAPAHGDTLFLNGRFFERLAGAVLMIVAARILVRLHHRLDSLMLTVSIGWAAFAVGGEFARLEIVSAWVLLHWAFAAAAISLVFVRIPLVRSLVGPLVLALGISAVLAQLKSDGDVAWISAIVAGAGMLAIALRPVVDDEGDESSRLLGAIGAPIMVALWMARYASGMEGEHWQFPIAVGAAFALAVLFGGMRAGERSRRWINQAADVFAVGLAFVLAIATLFDIGRAPSAATLEVLCAAGLGALAFWNGRRVRIGDWILPAAVIGAALVLQANLLRWLGPAGHLDVLDIFRMDWRALVTLLWAAIGTALTISARRVGSRAQWSVGAAFLVGAAIKVVLLDFGSLGQLANILAVIAAGGMFLLVGWLAPMPPSREPADNGAPDADPTPPAPPAAPRAAPDPVQAAARTPGATGTPASSTATASAPADHGRTLELPDSYWQAPRSQSGRSPERESTNRLGWTIAIACIALVTASQVLPRLFGHHDRSKPGRQQVTIEELAAAARSLPADADEESGIEVIPDEEPAVGDSEAPVPEAMTQDAVVPEHMLSAPPPLPRPAPSPEEGLEKLVREGVLRRATMRDMDAWRAAGGAEPRIPVHADYQHSGLQGEYLFHVFVVQREMEFPEGLYGAHLATFIVPRGVPAPTGNAGHSQILDMNP